MIKVSSIVLVIIAITGWLIYLFPNKAISPGNLLKKHGHLEENCSNCHDTFQGASGQKCTLCHAPEKIGIIQVNKQNIGQEKKKLSFHSKLKPDTCTTCHKEHQGRLTSNQAIQFSHEMLGLKNVNNCVECHQRPTNVMHEKSGMDCAQCHKTTNWASTEIDHSAYFKFDRDHQADCTTCHPNSNYIEYTCYNCHEHSPQKIEREHVKEGIRDYIDCVKCHRSGDEDEAKRDLKTEKSHSNSERDSKKYNNDRKPKKRNSKKDRDKNKKHSDDNDDHDDNDHD
ncbi:MAG: hypothetical protein HOD92_09105 [Deltaproteobacteria bacterium]|jgi:hypothetical protein|nr:hypothetical protein [Deltaproteobacteria bacterium]MBT4526728.1 hypothetical protein [Deltaproteobacteria bacterium]